VSSNGKPITGGSVMFMPTAESAAAGGSGRPAAGAVGADGRYVLGTDGHGAGAVIGKHKVLYSAPSVAFPEGKILKPGESAPVSPYANLVPKQEEVEVKAGSNTIDIELVPKATSGSRR